MDDEIRNGSYLAERDAELRAIGAKVDCRLDGAKRHARAAAVDLWEAGRLLIEAKPLAGHGRWLPWLAERGLEARPAQYLMKAARELTRDEVELAGSIRAAWRARRGQIRNGSYLPDAEVDDADPADGVPSGDREARAAHVGYLMAGVKAGIMDTDTAAALAVDDVAFAQWWAEGEPIRAMSEAEFWAAVERTGQAAG